MRIAILADIHGNSIALDQVLEDIHSAGGVDEYWLLGDLAAIGPDPVGALERVASLPKAKFVRGNTDRYLFTGELPGLSSAKVKIKPDQLEMYLHMARSFAWTAGAITVEGWLPWIKRLPLEVRMQLPDGSRVLAVHASPGMDDGRGIHPGVNQEELRVDIGSAGADLILVGHTHISFDRQVDRFRVVNPGSVSNPLSADLRASYLIMRADEGAHSLEFRKVPYDREAVIATAQEVNHPAAEYITRLLRGQARASWEENQASS